MNESIWGIDLGGTKIEGAILTSISDPTTLVRTRVDTEAAKGYDHIIRQIHLLVENMKAASGLIPKHIGFGTPGIIDPASQTLKNSNTTVLNFKPLQRDIQERLQIPVTLANDANCFALAETTWGAGKKQAKGGVVFGIIMGTGVGGGLLFDGKLWNGHHGIAGEWGHNFLDDSGGPCYCGKTGCVETILSGPALQRYYESITGIKKSLKDIVASRSADPAAEKTMQRLAHFFGKGVASITNMLDPDIIIIGGGVGNIDSIYTEGVESLRKFIFNNGTLSVPVVKPLLGDSAGVFGAAALTSV